MISGGSVMRLPTEKPNTAQAANRTGALSVWLMATSAAAWLISDVAVTSRGLSRSTTMPRQNRPSTAMDVVSATANPAPGRPTFGSSSAIWWTMKPICATSARANGTEIVQNANRRTPAERGVFLCVSGVCAGEYTVWCLTGSPLGGDGPIHKTTTGTRTTTMIAVAANIAAGKPILSPSSRSRGATTTPPQLAPLKATLMARPRRRTNQWLTIVAITTTPIPVQPRDMRINAA